MHIVSRQTLSIHYANIRSRLRSSVSLSLSLLDQPCVSPSDFVGRVRRAHIFVLSHTRRRRNLSLATHIASYFSFPLPLGSALAHHSSSKRVLLIMRCTPSVKKKSPSPFAFRRIFRPASSRSGPRVSYSIALRYLIARRSLSPVLTLFRLSRRLSFPRISFLRIFSSPRDAPRFLSLSRLLPSSASPLPPPSRARYAPALVTATIAGFSYIFVRPRAAYSGPTWSARGGGGAAPSPRRSRTVVT